MINSVLFREALGRCAPVLASNPVLPILDGFLLESDGENLHITTTDLQTDVRTSVPFTGSVNCVAPRLLLDTLKALQGDLSIEQANGSLVLKSATGVFKMAYMDSADYPRVELPESGEYVGDVSHAIDSVAWAASTDELRPIMQGVLWKQQKGVIEFVATDAHKLPVFRFEASGEDKSMVIPSKAAKLLTGEISVSLGENRATFFLPDKVVGVRLLDGSYPNYQAVIPSQNPFMAEADVSEVLQALKIVSIYANKTSNAIKLTFTENSIQLTAQDVNFGNEATQTVSAKCTGEMEAGFNVKFLIETLRKVEAFKLKGSAPNRAFIFESNNQFFSLLMPVQL